MNTFIFSNSLINWIDRSEQTECYMPNGSSLPSVHIFHKPVEILINDIYIKTRENACIIIPEKQKRHYKSLNHIYHETWFHFQKHDYISFLSSINLPIYTILYPNNIDRLVSMISSISAEHALNSEYSKEIVSLLLYRFFYELSRSANININKTKYNIKHINVIKELEYEIMKNLEFPWTVDIMAKKSCFSKSYLTRLFKHEMGTTPMDFIITQRINRSKLLLTNSCLNVDLVAQAVGFNSTSHFITEFKKRIGITPKQYAKNNSF